jgi:hypothetical protein
MASELARASAGAGGADDGSAPHDLERFCINVYLEPCVRGLVEYQTAHGSADDLAGADAANPAATLRAAAHVLERRAGAAGAVRAVAAALAAAAEAGAVTRDRGGAARTSEVVEAVLRAAEEAAAAAAGPPPPACWPAQCGGGCACGAAGVACGAAARAAVQPAAASSPLACKQAEGAATGTALASGRPARV